MVCPRMGLRMVYQSNLNHLRVFGAVAYIHTPPEKRPRSEKFAPRARTGYLIGYDDGINYHIGIPGTVEIVISAYVTFDETPGQAPLSATQFDLPMEDQPAHTTDTVTISIPSPLPDPIGAALIIPPLDMASPDELQADVDARFTILRQIGEASSE
ncbi:unnamed protein product [Calypogeia fissa]